MYIDLTIPLAEDTPIYPGDPPTKIEKANILERDGCNDHYLSTGNHAGTHIDAPGHVLANGETLAQIPIDCFVGLGRYIKIVGKTFDLDAIKRAGIQAGDIVLFHTGMSDRLHEASYYTDFPVIPDNVAEYLASCKIKMVGVDMGSVDHDTLSIHKILLGAGVLIIENLTNLAQLAGKEFKVYALPINLQIDGAPARVIAEIKE